jgi:uncharacterized membrane protein YfcA
MTLAAAYGAYFGGGLGIILFATLALGTGRSLRELNGLKTLIALVADTVAMLAFGILGPVHWFYVPGLAASSLVGGMVGVRVAKRIDTRVLRTVVVALGLGVGIRLLALA